MITIILAAIYQRFGCKAVLLIICAGCLFPYAEAAPSTILEGLQNTLTYIRFRENISWIWTGLSFTDFIRMEAALVALIQ
jgi:hypothetical protein